MTSELFSSVYKEKSDHLFDDRIFSCPVPAFTHWSIFVPLSENPWNDEAFLLVAGENKTSSARVVRTVEQFCAHILFNVQDIEAQNQQILTDLRVF